MPYSALNSESSMVKKQIIEILSAISMYSAEGRDVVLEALQTVWILLFLYFLSTIWCSNELIARYLSYQVDLQQKNPYQIIIDELNNDNIVAYKTSLVTFINCILLGEEDIDHRIMFRNEMIGKIMYIDFEILTNVRF